MCFFFYSVLANSHTTAYEKWNRRIIKTEDNTKTWNCYPLYGKWGNKGQ